MRAVPWMLALAPAAALLLAGCALAGCGLGAGTAPKATALLVTREFGAHVLHEQQHPQVQGQETVMRLLMRNERVTTRYSGGYVQSVDGLSAGSEGGRPVDWFYFVNGVSPAHGAAATEVSPGDHIWWDLHDWSQAQSIPAVVGSFPEPFQNGLEGKRLPVRVECAHVGGAACTAALEGLRAVGVLGAVSAPVPNSGEKVLRVLVGTWRDLSGDVAVKALSSGPSTSGVYARFSPEGSSLALLDPDGRTVRTLTAGAGLVAAVRREEAAPEWVLTGTDEAGVRLAAGALHADVLAHHFALALAPGLTQPLPAQGP